MHLYIHVHVYVNIHDHIHIKTVYKTSEVNRDSIRNRARGLVILWGENVVAFFLKI